MPKISVIIPVYKAEKYLRTCVESILFGEEQDLEVILVEDCSGDGSWQLCQQLAEQYDQVRCLRNERNSGVSHTRNRGLDAATGTYVLFVDSDDRVSSSYAKTLIETQEANPGKLVVCGYTCVDHVSQSSSVCDLPDVSVIKREDFLDLVGAVMLQQLWNKVFSLELIRKAGIRFDEQISMGEDYRFVLDVLEAADHQECVIIHRPLYDYVRWGNASLMSTWVSEKNYFTTLECYERINRICGRPSLDERKLEAFREQYLYSIAVAENLTFRERREITRKIMNGKRDLRVSLKQCKWRLMSRLTRYKSTIRTCMRKRQNNQKK